MNSGSRIKDLNFSLNADYRIGDLTLGSTTAFQHETVYNLQDLFVNSSYFSNNFRDAFAAIIGPIPGSPGSWATFNNTQFQAIDVKQTSEELKLLSPTDVPLSYVVEVFFSDQKVSLGTGRTFTPCETGYDTSSDTKTYDVYGRGTLKLSADNSLIAGLRSGIGLLCLAWSGAYMQVVLSVLLEGVGCGLLLPMLVAWNMRELPAARRGVGNGAFTSCLFLGMFLSPVAVLFTADQLGGRPAALMAIGVSLVVAAVIASGATLRRNHSPVAAN